MILSSDQLDIQHLSSAYINGLQRLKSFTYDGFSKAGRIRPMVSLLDNKA